MHFTRRLLDRRLSGALFVVACLAAGATGLSCSSADEDGGPFGPADAATDSPSNVDAAPSLDAGAADVTPSRDAAPFDGGPLPVVCASDSCATFLATTRGATTSDRAEGFCALLYDGTVACWGAGSAGQLGRGGDAGAIDSVTPARVTGLEEIVTLDNTCAIDKNGAAFCWGTGPYLRSPTAATTTEYTPVKLDIPSATRVAVGAAVGCALTSGGVLCWGSNRYGELAPFDTSPASAVLPATAMVLPPGEPLDNLAVGNAVFAVRADGSVVSWGANPPLGRISSLFPDPYPLPSALAGVSTIDGADDNACATAGGVGYCWGTVPPNPSGATQSGSRLERALPTPVTTPEPVVQISTTRTLVGEPSAPFVQPHRWCAVGASGSVYCWGYNASGQAGDGTKEYAYEAVRVAGLPAPAAQVKTTPEATCALLTSGKIHCWGTNFYGQLGSGKIKIANLSPQEVVLP